VNRFLQRMKSDSTLIVLLILIFTLIVGAVLVSLVGRNFFSDGNIRDILTGMSVLGLVAIGQTLVILGGSLDLSVGYVVSLSSLVGAITMGGNAANIPLAVLATLGVCVLVGLVNGVLVSVVKVNGFIATLGTGLIISGYLATTFKGTAGSAPWEFQVIGATGIGPVPISTVIMLALAALIWFLLSRTRTGAHLYAVGGDHEVSRLSGVRTQPPMIVAHVFCSIFAGLAGLLLASRSGVGNPLVGEQGGYALLSIAAVVLGGTLLMGGRGSVWGTIGGVAILAVLDNVMSVTNVTPFAKDVVRGIIIIAAVAVYARRVIVVRRARFGPHGTRTASAEHVVTNDQVTAGQVTDAGGAR